MGLSRSGIAATRCRTRNSISRDQVHLVDDTEVAQIVQAELYPTELRYAQRLSHFGFGSWRCPARRPSMRARAAIGGTMVLGVEDGRYRPRSMRGGETAVHGDGAAADGNGGATRPSSRLARWIANLWRRSTSARWPIQ